MSVERFLCALQARGNKALTDVASWCYNCMDGMDVWGGVVVGIEHLKVVIID